MIKNVPLMKRLSVSRRNPDLARLSGMQDLSVVERVPITKGDDGIIRVFDIDSGQSVAEIPAHASGIKKIATSPVNGDILSRPHVRITTLVSGGKRTPRRIRAQAASMASSSPPSH